MSKRSTLLSMLVFLATTSSVHAAGSIIDRPDFGDLIYDPRTGDVALDAADDDTGRLLEFKLRNNMDAFRTENTVFPWLDIGPNTTNEPSEIRQVVPIGDDGLEFFELGEILPTGMSSPEAVQALLTEAIYQPNNLVDPREFDIIVVPEPSSASLLLVALLLGGMFRRIAKGIDPVSAISIHNLAVLK